MAGVAQVGIDTINAGVPILGTLQAKVLIAGASVAIVGDLITPHGSSPHGSTSKITVGNARVKLAGIDIAINGSACSCGHAVNSGSTRVTD